ncbi:beta-ketoacyl-ACP synthase II [Christensenellaceae bacterium OttesenSCG-928-M15]|nr:beta-ketoacyl-ACP synthase II [Christensenellaceae bacterium OttesenSCG-928-M15]
MKRVVITGMGIISPIGNTICSYWDHLKNGVCGIGPITRFDATGYKATLAAEVKDFNHKDYGIDVPAARRMDLYTQYAMAAAKQAADDSKIVGQIDPERLGVYVGSGIGGMHTFAVETNKLNARGPDRVSPFFVPMMISNIAAGNIAIEYNAQGPTLPVVTACATSTNSIGEAFRAIRYGYADAIFAGGAEATIEPIAIAGFTNCQALSLSENPDEASLPFDIRRKGFVMGEGAGIVLLEEYEHAKARGAHIYAEVAGYGNTCDAHHITAPREDAKGALRAIRMAAEEAEISSGDSLYINAHGTGTPLNDASETLAIKLALGEDMAKRALVSSTKSMMGHMLGAAGAAEAIACALTLQNGIVPPTINLKEPDPACDLDNVPNTAREKQCTSALSTSLGFGGHNACVAFRSAD